MGSGLGCEQMATSFFSDLARSIEALSQKQSLPLMASLRKTLSSQRQILSSLGLLLMRLFMKLPIISPLVLPSASLAQLEQSSLSSSEPLSLYSVSLTSFFSSSLSTGCECTILGTYEVRNQGTRKRQDSLSQLSLTPSNLQMPFKSAVSTLTKSKGSSFPPPVLSLFLTLPLQNDIESLQQYLMACSNLYSASPSLNTLLLPESIAALSLPTYSLRTSLQKKWTACWFLLTSAFSWKVGRGILVVGLTQPYCLFSIIKSPFSCGLQASYLQKGRVLRGKYCGQVRWVDGQVRWEEGQQIQYAFFKVDQQQNQGGGGDKQEGGVDAEEEAVGDRPLAHRHRGELPLVFGKGEEGGAEGEGGVGAEGALHRPQQQDIQRQQRQQAGRGEAQPPGAAAEEQQHRQVPEEHRGARPQQRAPQAAGGASRLLQVLPPLQEEVLHPRQRRHAQRQRRGRLLHQGHQPREGLRQPLLSPRQAAHRHLPQQEDQGRRRQVPVQTRPRIFQSLRLMITTVNALSFQLCITTTPPLHLHSALVLAQFTPFEVHPRQAWYFLQLLLQGGVLVSQSHVLEDGFESALLLKVYDSCGEKQDDSQESVEYVEQLPQRLRVADLPPLQPPHQHHPQHPHCHPHQNNIDAHK